MIMKKNKLFLIAFALIGMFISCDDAINIKQPGEVNNPDDVYKTIDDLQRGLNGVYAVFSTESTISFTSIFTDESAIGINNGGQGLNDGLYTFQLTAGSDYATSIWQANYSLINFANRIIDAGAKIAPTTDINDPNYDEEALTNYGYIMGQLYAIRAFAHFQLLSYFSTDLKDDSKLGVIILDFVPDENYDTYLPRSTNAECFKFIEEDLAKAEATIAPDYAATLVTPDFITALRARMAAYRGNYPDALKYANQLLVPASLYPLSSNATAYNGIWDESSVSEVIFKLARVNGDSEIGATWNNASSSKSGSPYFEVNRGLFNLYDLNDYRRGISTQEAAALLKADPKSKFVATNGLIDITSTISANPDTDPLYVQNDVLVINKYPGNTAQNDLLLNDIKVFRIAEMYLIKAEAFAAAGSLNGTTNSVASVLKALRDKRYNSGTAPVISNFASAEEAWAAILQERRKELAFEGHRYIDIKRLGVLAGGKGIERYSRDCEKYSACTLDPTDHRFTMPIPTTELTANPNIRSQQNPGY